MENICVLCNEQLDTGETVLLGEKGVKGLEQAAAERKDTISVTPGKKVHTSCRRVYTHPTNVVSANRKDTCEANEKINLRSETVFSFKDDCLFCGKSIKETCRLRPYMEHYYVKTTEFQNEIFVKAKERNDEWGNEVLARIEFSRDLHAYDARYHQNCSLRFRKKREKPSENYGSKKRRTSCGRNKCTNREEAFLKVVEFLAENDDEQITVQCLTDKMREILGGQEAFTAKYMKTRLKQHFGDEIMITTLRKKDNVVTFRRKASKILHDFHSLPNYDDAEREKMKIIETASKLIKSDIKGLAANKDTYPGTADMNSQNGVAFLPETLKLFLSEMFVGKCSDVKIAAIGQAIMQATRPRLLITPLQLGLGVQLHHHYGSRHLIDTLHNLGLCCSYKEVQRFEQSAAVTNDSQIPGFIPGHFVQYVADNVDHQTKTIDGKDTFHGMGIIAAATPGVKSNRNIPRLKVTTSELEEIGTVKIHPYILKQFDDLRYEPLTDVLTEDTTYNIDFLWKTTWLLKDGKTSWNGALQMVNNSGQYPGQSSIVFMPMLDLNPSDETCIFSTLVWISEHAKRYNVTPVITFDQPLWFKANRIITSEPVGSDVKNIVVRLGGFHTEMSFLGAIGYIMSDSGLQEILSIIYAEKAVNHMLSGKAISRAIRGHGIVHMALQSLIVSEVFGVDVIHEDSPDRDYVEDEPAAEQGIQSQDDTCEELDEPSNVTGDLADQHTYDNIVLEDKSDEDVDGSDHMNTHTYQIPDNIDNHAEENIDAHYTIDIDLKCALNIFDSVLTGDISIEMACQAEVIKRMQARMDCYCDQVRRDSRTSRLWLQYIEMVELLRTFIKAERLGNWTLHLHTLKRMLPFFTASGHNLYAKSAYLYLSNMQKLPQTHPQLYNHFMEGFHVIRRSDRYWAGLSTDLVIEQTLMRSLKSVGGLTRGRGMTDVQRAVWILSRPATSGINEAMQGFCGTMYTNSEQHNDTTTAVRTRDEKDTQIIIEYMNDRNPFKTEEDLKSITSGVVSQASNADQAKDIGERVVINMVDKTLNEYTFRKKDRVIQMNDKAGIKIDGDTVKLDPQLLFQRLVMAANRSTEETQLPQLLSHELCTHPASLFETPRMMRAADKPSLANAMKTKDNPSLRHALCSGDMCHVIDGGMLLQWLPWECGQTYDEIGDTYTRFIQSKFCDPTIVFDGYADKPSTKDNVHIRRSVGIVGTEVRFDGSTKFRGKKAMFLSNSKNKQAFVNLLSSKLNSAGIATSHAAGDADVPIVLTAVRCSLSKTTVLVGDDTDLLVLLCHHASQLSNPIYLQPRTRRHKEAISWDIHKLQKHLGDEVCQNILFIHAILGCDTTSRLYGFGKGMSLKLFTKCESFRNAAYAFNVSPENVEQESIMLFGEQALVAIYKGSPGQTLNSVRYGTFLEKVAKSSVCIDPKQLPPTSDAAKFHSLRVYLQIHDWKGETVLRPLEWGWELEGNKYYPTTTDKAPAPTNIMKVVRCTCQSGCKTLACSCRKVGFECSSACSTCKGLSCENAIQADLE